ncbi:MAG: CHAT domain-containing protein, partial [Cyanobacteria bacterium]|nr:CHAT domain-containing protein [Cyanobacteriota bacterium]
YLTNIGRLFERMGQLQPAFDYLARAVSLFDDQRANIKADDLKTSFANRGGDLYKDMVRVCLALGKRVEALEYVGRAKSRALLDLLSNSPIDISTLSQSEDEGLRTLILKERELREQIDHLERVFYQSGSGQSSSSSESGHRGGVYTIDSAQGLYSNWRDVVGQLKHCHPNYATLVSGSTLSFDEIKRLWSGGEGQLSPSTAIVEYFWTDDYIMAASIGASSSEPVIHILADESAREALAVDLETFLEMSSTEGWEVPVSLCRRLYEQLLKPVLEGISPEVTRLMIVPHGSLFHMPFAALHDGNGYLCEKYAFSYVPSISLVPVLFRTVSTQPQTSRSRYLVSAISDYSATRRDGLVFSSTLRSAAGLDDLSYTVEEARSILKVGEVASNEARLLTNEEVKLNLATLFGEYSVVHFAGHAIFNPEEPMASGLVLSDGTVLTAASILERSSLRTNCGRLLVLSACQTGVNLVTPGGEILGLARALMYAGMPNLVLSLWEVADRSTSDLMQSFHSLWKAGEQSIAQALQQAQKKAIESGQPIHAWAPFIHFGID